jgi:flagellar basal body-associated protein FliL
MLLTAIVSLFAKPSHATPVLQAPGDRRPSFRGNVAATDSADRVRMDRRTLLAAAVALSALSPAQAAEEEKKGKDKKGDVGQYVDLQPVGLPIVSNRVLVNYVFVYVRINLTSLANASKLREKEPYFRDALVRLGHRTPFTLPSDLSKIDTVRLTAALKQEVVRIVGPGQVTSVVVTSQAPRRRISTPRA